MKTLKLLILGLCLTFSFGINAQTIQRAATSKLTIKPPVKCSQSYRVSVKGSVREPNHQISNKVKTSFSNGKFYIRALKPINENHFLWAQFPFKQDYASGKITGMKIKYSIKSRSSARRVYISQERMVQGSQPFKGVVRIDDPKNLYGSGVHQTNANTPFQSGSNYKTVSLKLVMQPGDMIIIEAITVLYKCPGGNGPIITFKCPPYLPNPKIKFAGAEKSGNFIRYQIPVYNYNAFPDYLFHAAPTLPACGANNNASRSWIDIYDQNNNRIYGFCAFGKAADMKKIWFAVQKGKKPPVRVRVVITDRGCNRKYKSNWISIPPV